MLWFRRGVGSTYFYTVFQEEYCPDEAVRERNLIQSVKYWLSNRTGCPRYLNTQDTTNLSHTEACRESRGPHIVTQHMERDSSHDACKAQWLIHKRCVYFWKKMIRPKPMKDDEQFHRHLDDAQPFTGILAPICPTLHSFDLLPNWPLR